MISFAFDDGWKNQYTRALPTLDKYNFKATFYVITQMPKFMLEEGEGRMSKEDWVNLYNQGHEIGSHSQTHPNFNSTFPLKVKREIVESKKDLEKLGIEVETFAYPYGRKGISILTNLFLRKAGYKSARVYDGKFTSPNIFTYALSTKNVYNDTSIEEIRDWVDTCEKDDTWTILSFHQVENNPQKWGCTPEMFEKICEYIHQKNVKVLTVSESLKHFNVFA